MFAPEMIQFIFFLNSSFRYLVVFEIPEWEFKKWIQRITILNQKNVNEGESPKISRKVRFIEKKISTYVSMLIMWYACFFFSCFRDKFIINTQVFWRLRWWFWWCFYFFAFNHHFDQNSCFSHTRARRHSPPHSLQLTT